MSQPVQKNVLDLQQLKTKKGIVDVIYSILTGFTSVRTFGTSGGLVAIITISDCSTT